MDELELRQIIYDHIKEICHYSQMQVFATSLYQKNYFQLQIDEVINGLTNIFLEYSQKVNANHNEILQQGNQDMQEDGQQPEQELQQEQQAEQELEQELQTRQEQQTGQEQIVENGMISITLEELEYYDGSNGKAAYVAVNGKVYDVTSVVRWAGGSHFGLQAGKDLSIAFMGCHQGMIERLQNVPQIGVII